MSGAQGSPGALDGAGQAVRPILCAVAAEVLARPAGADLPPDPEALAGDRAPLLLAVLERFPVVRRLAAERLAASGAGARTRALAAVLLHPDDDVVRTALAWLRSDGRGRADTAPAKADRAADRAARKIADLRGRLKAANGRLDYARRDAEDAARSLAVTRAALADQEERVEALRQRLAIDRRRREDPHALAAALLALLEQASGHVSPDAKADPARTGSPAGAAREAGGASEDVLAALRAMVDPAPPPAAVTEERELRVVPLGGDDHIGGSCLLVEAGGTRILLDAGLRPGERSVPPRDIEQALAGDLDAVVVTHAHNDHCGYVPVLVARRPRLRVLATPETVGLMPVMWADTAKVLARRASDRARWGGDGTALYGIGDVEAAARRCEEVPFGAVRRIGALEIELFPAGHILGAAGAVVRAGDRRVVVTGDISGFRQETVDGYRVPDSARSADLLVMESTCCGDDHDDRDMRVGELLRAVAEVHQGGGRVLIPAFALGRAQEIAMILRRNLPEVPVRIDGMAIDLAEAYETLAPIRLFGGAVSVADRPADLDAFRTGVVIATSGMLTGGPAVQWARRILPEPGSALFISGYQDEESPGAALLDVRAGGRFTLMDRDREVTVPVRARVDTVRLSAHADRRGLFDIADEAAAREVMLVHGVPRRQRRFGESLRMRGHAPAATGPWRPAPPA